VQFLDFWRRGSVGPGHRGAAAGRSARNAEEELQFDLKVVIVTGRFSEDGIKSLEESAQRAADEGTIDNGKDKERAYYSYLLREVPGLGDALAGKETELYSVHDRLISEYEFRIGIGAPLIALIVTLAIRWSSLWLLALLPMLALLAAGSQQRMAAGDLLADAIRLKRIDVALPQELAPKGTTLTTLTTLKRRHPIPAWTSHGPSVKPASCSYR
jgi:hypothetical protein